MKNYKFLLVLLFGLSCAGAHAQTTVLVNVIFTPRAVALLPSGTTVSDMTSCIINKTNTVWSNSDVNGSVSLSDSTTSNAFYQGVKANGLQKLDEFQHSPYVARIHDGIAGGTDLTIVVDDLAIGVFGDGLGEPNGGASGGIPTRNVYSAIAVTDIGNLLSNDCATAAHEISHLAGARHWNDHRSNGAGWYVREGTQTDPQCLNDLMTYNVKDGNGDPYDYIPAKSCNGWSTSFTLIAFSCDAADFCQRFAEYVAPGDGQGPGPYVGTLDGEGEGLACKVGRVTSTGTSYFYRTVIGVGSTGTQPQIACTPRTIPYLSNPLKLVDGHYIGGTGQDAVTEVNSNLSKIVAQRGKSLVAYQAALQLSTGGATGRW